MSQEKTKILLFDSSLDRANSMLVRFPQAVVVTSVANAAESIRAGRPDILVMNTGEFAAEELVEWLLTYYPSIKRVFLYGQNFELVAYLRNALRAGGYPTMYMSFPQLLTFTSI